MDCTAHLCQPIESIQWMIQHRSSPATNATLQVLQNLNQQVFTDTLSERYNNQIPRKSDHLPPTKCHMYHNKTPIQVFLSLFSTWWKNVPKKPCGQVEVPPSDCMSLGAASAFPTKSLRRKMMLRPVELELSRGRFFACSKVLWFFSKHQNGGFWVVCFVKDPGSSWHSNGLNAGIEFIPENGGIFHGDFLVCRRVKIPKHASIDMKIHKRFNAASVDSDKKSWSMYRNLTIAVCENPLIDHCVIDLKPG